MCTRHSNYITFSTCKKAISICWNIFSFHQRTVLQGTRVPHVFRRGIVTYAVVPRTLLLPSITGINTRWFKYDRDKLWLVYTQSVPVIFEPPCNYHTLSSVFSIDRSSNEHVIELAFKGDGSTLLSHICHHVTEKPDHCVLLWMGPHGKVLGQNPRDGGSDGFQSPGRKQFWLFNLPIVAPIWCIRSVDVPVWIGGWMGPSMRPK